MGNAFRTEDLSLCWAPPSVLRPSPAEEEAHRLLLPQAPSLDFLFLGLPNRGCLSGASTVTMHAWTFSLLGGASSFDFPTRHSLGQGRRLEGVPLPSLKHLQELQP